MRNGARQKGQGRGAWYLAAILSVSAAALNVGPAFAGAPAQAIQETRSAISQIVHDPDLRGPGMREERRRRLNDVVGERLSYEEMSRRVLGAEWQRLNDEERGEFIRAFRMLLCNMYAHKIEDYGGEPMEIIGERLDNGIAEVRARMAARKSNMVVDFRLVNRDGEWRVFDILTDGISLVNNYRQQFQRVLHSASYPELLQKLRDATDRSTAAFARY
jgi:phospholipid transport system substrate-binding protein